MSLPVPHSPTLASNVPLAALTTLELGGPARFLLTATSDAEVLDGLRWAAATAVPVFILGGGSNLIVADAGFDGLVIRLATRGVTLTDTLTSDGPRVLLEAQAGEPWDALVATAVTRDLAGLECLSGIPGLAGATPIQNVGAYGQEVSDTIHRVRAVDRQSLQLVDLPPQACAFGYRDSLFRRQPQRYVVLSVSFALRPGGAPLLRYGELKAALASNAARSQPPSLADVRATVLQLRRRKSMVIDPADPNRRSVGSFFTNPILSQDQAQALIARLIATGVVSDPAQVPQFPGPDGDGVKLSAGWLIERAGIQKGLRVGPVGVSSNHALALVHHGGGTTADLLALASRVRRAVVDHFDVTLSLEPILLGDIFVAP